MLVLFYSCQELLLSLFIRAAVHLHKAVVGLGVVFGKQSGSLITVLLTHCLSKTT